MIKNKKTIIFIIVLLIGSVFIGITLKYIKDKKDNDKKLEMIEENSNKNNIDNDFTLDEELEKEEEINYSDIFIEEGFKTSIASGNTEKEIIRNNLLLESSKFSVEERIKAKNVAETFVQAIESFDIEKPKETVDRAVKYVVDEKKEEVKMLYAYLGKNQTIKKKVIDKVTSYELDNKFDNDYIIFDVYVNWSVIDNYNQISNEGSESYEVKLLKIKDEYKVVEYFIS
ncbi:MAG: hypothetical protein KH415_11250 [Clostridium sp.]|nr:hypothetical protein [Clostridium sp.]